MTASGRFRVLVVCTGNICRSPMGELILRDSIDRGFGVAAASVVVSSAGTYGGHAGERMQPGAAAVMRERGIAHEEFRATALTERIVAESDLILTAERAHRADVVRLSPGALQRAFTLVEFGRLVASSTADAMSRSSGDDVAARFRSLVTAAAQVRGLVPPPVQGFDDDVDDPYGLPVEEFRWCADRIEHALSPVVAGLLAST